MLAALARWSLDHPRLVAAACLWFLVFGALALRGARFEVLPNLTPAQATVETQAPGLTAEQVEQLVTRPIEAQLIGTAGVAHVHSDSVQGLSVVTLDFAPGADPFRARQTAAESLAAVGSLPPGVFAPRIAQASGGGVLTIGFTSRKLDPMALRDLVQWTVRPRLLATPGVARVAVYGGQVRRIEVQARPADLSDSDLGFLDIVQAVRRATAVAGAGFIDTGGQRVLIEPHGQTLTPDQVAAGQIQTPGSAPTRIGDVADVVTAPAPAFGDATVAGGPAVLLVVARQYGADTLETTAAIERTLAVLAPALAAQGVSVRTDLDRPASFIGAAVRGILLDLLGGAALIGVALAVFLRDLRAVLISLVTLPLAFLAAAVALRLIGWSFNAMTLGGLAVALGVVVDDAVIDVENIVARLREAESRHASRAAAVFAAALEVRGPVVYATLAVVMVLAPLLALRGVQGMLLAPLAGAIIAAALASLVVAAVVTPGLSLLFLRHIGPAAEPAILRGLKDAHARWLDLAGRRTGLLLAACAAVVALALVAVPFLRAELLPPVSDGHLVIQTRAPAGVSLGLTRDYGERVSAGLGAIPGVVAVSQRIGRDPTGVESWGPERGVIDLELAPNLPAAAQGAIAYRARDVLAAYPGVQSEIRTRFDAAPVTAPGEGRGLAGAAPFEAIVYGPDLDALDAAAPRIAAALRRLPGARRVALEAAARAPAVRIDLDFPRLALFGLSAADVLDTVQAAFQGERVAEVYDGARVVDLAVSAQASLRRDPESVGNLLLRSTSGISVPLKAVANVYLTDARASVVHDDGLRRAVITAGPLASDRGAFARGARAVFARPGALPPGAFVEFAGADLAAAAAARDLLGLYALAVFGVVALLTVAFDGRSAAVILASTLFSVVGATAAAALLGPAASAGALIGVVSLFGISMRGAILLLTRLEDLAAGGRAPWSPALVAQAARERLTPILMTSLLVALGLAPLAIQAGEAGREILGPMAIVIIGGLVTGAIGAVMVLPALVSAVWRPGRIRHGRAGRAAARGAPVS